MGSLSIDHPDLETERKYCHFIASVALINGYSGRKLYRLFKQQNLYAIELKVFPITINHNDHLRASTQADSNEFHALAAGIFANDTLEQWRSALEQAESDGVYFACINLMLYVGQKPCLD